MGAPAFTNPALAWGALAAAVPLAIHLLSKRRVRKVPFAAMAFLMRARRQKVSSIRLRDMWLLAVRMLLVGLLGLAVARPFWRKDASAQATTTVAATALVLDGSLSMRWKQGDRSLFDTARREAVALLESLPPESPATVVLCDGRAPTVNPPDFDRAALRRQMNDARASLRPADLSPCLSAAARALGESPVTGKRIYVFSDMTARALSLDGPPPRVPTPQGEVLPEVVFVDAAQGKPLNNLAVVDVTVTPSASLGPRGYELAATVHNGGPSAAQGVSLLVKVNGQVATRGFVDAAPGATVRKVLAHRFDPGVNLVQVALAGDALVEDDTRELVLEVPRDVRALVVDGAPSAVKYQDEAFFVETALGAARTGGRITSTFVDADAAPSRNLSDFDVVLLLNVPAPSFEFAAALRLFVESGGGLWVTGGDQVDPDAWNAALGPLLPRPLHLLRTAAEPPAVDTEASSDTPAADGGGAPPARIVRVESSHPVMAPFATASDSFSSARFYRYLLPQTDNQEGVEALAVLDDGTPLLTAARRGRGRVLFYGATADRDWTDWPLRPTFLPVVQQATAWLGGGLETPPAIATLVGEKRLVTAPDGATLAEVTGPDGRGVKPVEGGYPVELAGIYKVFVEDGAGRREAQALTFAGVVDAREGDYARVDPEALARHFGGEQNISVAAGAEAALPRTGTPLWPWLLLAVVAALVAESWLVRRERA